MGVNVGVNKPQLVWKYIWGSLSKLHVYSLGRSLPKLLKELWNFKFVPKVMLRSFVAFPIFHNHVSRKQLIIERKGPKCGPQGYMYLLSIHSLLLKCSMSFRGHSVYFRFSTTLYLENGWTESETDQNLVLRSCYSVYTVYSWLLSAQGQSEVIQCTSDIWQDYMVTSATPLIYMAVFYKYKPTDTKLSCFIWQMNKQIVKASAHWALATAVFDMGLSSGEHVKPLFLPQIASELFNARQNFHLNSPHVCFGLLN